MKKKPITVGIECESIEGKNPMFGVGRMILELLKEIAGRPELAEHFRFVLYFKDRVPDMPFLAAAIFEKKIVPVPFFKNRLFPLYYFLFLPVRLWFDRPDLMFWPNYMLPIIASNKALVVLTEDVYYETHSGRLPFRYRLAYGIFGWWTAKFADTIMAISETSKKNLAKLYRINLGRIVVNRLGIDFADSVPRAIQQSPRYILFVGQAFPRRHLKETILALERLSTTFPDLKLVAVGPDKYPEPTVDPLVTGANERLGREAIVHKSYVSDGELAMLYAGAAALVYVSDREAFGLPPLEALSFGVPPLISDNELGHELFGDYALYARESSPEGIADGIRKALTESAKIQTIKSEGPQFARQYSWKKFADRWLEIVNES